MQKKFFSLVLMLIAAINTFAYRDFTVDGIRYQILSEENGTCAVCGHEELTKSNLVIPTSVTNGNGTKYTVKSIGYEAFADCSGLTSITIPESVTHIRESILWVQRSDIIHYSRKRNSHWRESILWMQRTDIYHYSRKRNSN